MDEAAIMIQSVWRGKKYRQLTAAMRGNKQWHFETAAAIDIQRASLYPRVPFCMGKRGF